MPNPESPPEKPWAILGITRKQYAAAKPWKKTGMTKENYAEMLNLIPHEDMQILKDVADAERLGEHVWDTRKVINRKRAVYRIPLGFPEERGK